MAESGADDSGVLIGTVLGGRYRIAGLLGKGGMGRVYRGEHTGLGKTVAVKVLHSALGSSREAAIRFQREAIASGRLDHPNIVTVIDFGTLDDGALYLVMEALEGEHVGERIARERRIPWREALLITRSVLLGLKHAHDRGVVHRDIKPDNIFIANKDGDSVVKLLDFGIAKLYVGAADDQQNATSAGITVGTPTYLSPEQAVGGAITPLCDIYSTSVVLYEMLVGHAPFESDDPLTLLTSHAGSEPPTFHDVAPALDVPPDVEALVRRGLAKTAADRIGSTEYVQQIDAILIAHGVDVPQTPFARASQSIGIPLGPWAVTTPSSSFLTVPTPPPVVQAEAPRANKPAAVTAPPRRTARRTRVVVAAIALAVAGGAAAMVVHLRAGHAEEATAPAAAPPIQPDDHAASLRSALHELDSGASCNDRKKAIAKLVELGDPTAVPAIKKAELRTKSNACLRVAAERAIARLTTR